MTPDISGHFRLKSLPSESLHPFVSPLFSVSSQPNETPGHPCSFFSIPQSDVPSAQSHLLCLWGHQARAALASIRPQAGHPAAVTRVPFRMPHPPHSRSWAPVLLLAGGCRLRVICPPPPRAPAVPCCSPNGPRPANSPRGRGLGLPGGEDFLPGKRTDGWLPEPRIMELRVFGACDSSWPSGRLTRASEA